MNLPKPKDFTMDDRFPKEMTWDVLLDQVGLGHRDVIVTIVKPVRNGEYYKKGRLTGFKSGIWGGGHSRFKDGFSHSFDSSKQHWIKKPKVHVTYDIFNWGKRCYNDWVDVDNCTFEIIKTN